ncbi:putative serine/threonine-protein kinase tsuA [Colletotrichum siamense]|nr:putative serine/threonine-protein kinase tsuA [Colletotrichum siamense]KAF4873738.1 putative serine/threonine-protein kinase tsuA [Colletotrichum siamense]
MTQASQRRAINLAPIIYEACETSEYDSRNQFLPHGRIHDLVTEESITSTLRIGIPPDERDEPGNLSLARRILHDDAKTFFGIALLVGLSGPDLIKGMKQVLDSGVGDKDLPTTKTFWESKGLYSESSTGDDWVLPVWTFSRVQSFIDNWQWTLLAPIFSVEDYNHDLHPRSVLPFTKVVAEYTSGAFGTVTAYQIHPAHLIDSKGQLQHHHAVAVKKIHDVGKSRQKIVSSWEKEVAILKQMNNLKQDHIVRFLTAFRFGMPGKEEHHLMLEWAEGGDLRNLWKAQRRPSLTANLVKDTFHQLLGLAEAIKKAHYPESGPNFRHGDLKPENILWFGKDSMDLLKIGDWGLAKKHNLTTELRNKSTTTKDGTRAYQPPEEFVTYETNLLTPNKLGKKKSRLYDMWAFGCITLEFLIWLVYGFEQLETFNRILQLSNNEAPRFYQIEYTQGRPTAKVHDIVTRWMDHMAQDPIFAPGQTALGNLLEVVRNRLLVVKLPRRLGTWINLPQDVPMSQQPIRLPSLNSEDAITPTDDTDAQKPSTSGLPTFNLEAPKASLPEKKLIEPMPQNQSSSGWERASAIQFFEHMLSISGEDEEERYWFTGLPNPDRGPSIGENDRIVQKSKENAEAFRTELSKNPSSFLSQIKQ